MSRLRSLAVLSAVVALAGCYSYRPATLARIEPKNQVRVTTRDGRREELVAVTVAADTLRGLGAKERWPWGRRDRIAIAVADLSEVEVQRLNVGRSVVAVVGMAAFIAIPALAIAGLGNVNLLGGRGW